jgi:putative DNA primase/helicase
MVAAVRDVAGKLKGVHLTYITADGRKAFGDRSRLMFGAVSGCSVQLAPLTVHGVLCVGEGIETSASFADFKGVPTWAALSTSGLQNFTPPAGVRKLLIAADSDDAGAGLKAATALAQRLRRSCDVEIHPAPAGFDWNDPEARAGHD